MTPRRKPRAGARPKHTQHDVLAALGRALNDAEELVLAVGLQTFLDDPLRRAAGRDALNRVRTAVQKLDAATLRLMPEVVADEIAAIRNLAVYDYLEEADELVYRTLKNGVPQWRSGAERAARALQGEELPTPVPSRSDGTLAAARPRPLCGRPVRSTGRPCLLKKGHGGNCRSR